MKRRTLLATVGVGVAGLAGCPKDQGSDGSETAASTASPTPTRADEGPLIAPEQPEGRKARFQLTGISAESTAELGTDYSFEVTVENTGDLPGVYREPVSVKPGRAVRYEELLEALVYVEGGETFTATISIPAFESVGRVDVRFGGSTNSWTVDVVGPELAMGESFRVDGFDVTYESVEFRESVSYESGAVPIDLTTGPDEQLAVVTVSLTSVESTSWMAESGQYQLELDGERIEPATDAGYSMRALAVDQTERVELPYRVSSDVTRDGLVFRYTGMRENRYARWSPAFPGEGNGD